MESFICAGCDCLVFVHAIVGGGGRATSHSSNSFSPNIFGPLLTTAQAPSTHLSQDHPCKKRRWPPDIFHIRFLIHYKKNLFLYVTVCTSIDAIIGRSELLTHFTRVFTAPLQLSLGLPYFNSANTHPRTHSLKSSISHTPTPRP